ncbi:synaptic vesicle glycoprotein 2C-like isoform X1 [Athalia rosae]|uniref:synaptic vesicle glycoprotein 2C-like isoform X1 n=1 Tax=Athalia rosae TaxID=37344 RepID=UPI0020337468|nr:synaptic vesicle glycoprotein 2C-like isoform X1 [Athalia rosae]XP_048513044.1 synaptic vesicle glycoprotein 2C-like isoform X1 [Athalia rosae]
MAEGNNNGVSETRNEEIDLEKVTDFTENKFSTRLEDEGTELEEAINLTGLGRFHAVLIFTSGLSLLSMVLEAAGISFMIPAAQCDLALTVTEKSYLSGMTYWGMVISAHTWGFSADTFGRKKVLVVSAYTTWVSSFISSFAPNASIFIAFRFLTGVFLCGTTSTVYAYLSEFLPASKRSRIITWTCGFIAGGFLLIPGLAWLLLPVQLNWDLGFVLYGSWRLYIAIASSLILFEGSIFLYLPESPKFLMSVGRKEAALEVLKNIYAQNSGNSPENYPVKSLRFEKIGSADDTANETPHVSPRVSFTPRGLADVIWRQTAPLFRKPYGWTTLLFCTLQFGIYCSSGGLYLWMPNILNMMTSDVGVGNSEPETICEFVAYQVNITSYATLETTECSDEIRTGVYMSSLVLGAFYVVTYGAYGGLVSLFGKRKVLVSMLCLSGISGIGSYFARDEITVTVLMSAYIVLSGTCVSILGAAIVDAYPTHLRAMAVSLTLTCGRFGTGVAGNVIGIFIETYCGITLIGLGCVTLICALLAISVPDK